MIDLNLFEIIKLFLIAIVFICGLGFVIGFAVTVFGRFFHSDIDPMISQILDVLPDTNCGVCGYPSCLKYADSIINKNEKINLCHPGSEKIINDINKALGKDKLVKVKESAKIFCLGDNETSKKDYYFNGYDSCSIVFDFFGGDKSCKYGCLGMGDCIKICPVGAIKRDEYNRVWIDANICNSCKKCIEICPRKVIKMVPVNGGYFVACSNHDESSKVTDMCKKGCTGCKICEKISGTDRIYIENDLATVIYENDTDLYSAALKCPVDVIVPIINQTVYMSDNKNNKQEKKAGTTLPSSL